MRRYLTELLQSQPHINYGTDSESATMVDWASAGFYDGFRLSELAEPNVTTHCITLSWNLRANRLPCVSMISKNSRTKRSEFNSFQIGLSQRYCGLRFPLIPYKKEQFIIVKNENIREILALRHLVMLQVPFMHAVKRFARLSVV